MRASWLYAPLLLLAGARPLAAATLPSPLAPAGGGEIQCYVPNLAQKTCQLIASYSRDKAGTIQNVAAAVISKDPFIVMTTTAPVQVRDGRVCGTVRPEDFATASFAIGGRAADLRQTADLRVHVADGMKSLIGHEICQAYVKERDAWVARSFLDGAPQVDGDEAFVWVAGNAGYAVGP